MRSDSSPTYRKKAGFQTGKIPPSVLERSVFPYLGKSNGRVLVGPGIGRDSAIVRFNRGNLVFSTDPITGATRHIGRHAILVNANDVAVTGAKPLWFLCTLLLPPGTSESDLEFIMKEVDAEAKRLGITVVRGHTEATMDLKHPILAGFMVGESRTGRFFTADRGREGDRIIMTKTAGIEGTAVLAADRAGLLKRKGVDPLTIRMAERFADEISIVREARIASRTPGVNAMHDPTEGGVINGLWELAEASHLGLDIEEEEIPVSSETRTVCDALGLDPLKLLGSGSLLIACRSRQCGKLIKSFGQAGISAREIGRLASFRKGRFIRKRAGGRDRILPVYRDELYSL